MSKELKIAVDCDDVLVDTAQPILGYYNSRYGTQLQLRDFYSNDYAGVWQAPDSDTAIKRVNEYLGTKEFLQLQPTQEALETISAIGERHELHIVTGRPDFIEAATTVVI